MSDYVTLTIPAAVRDDFVDAGWDAVTEGLQEKPGMRDAFTAVEFSMPKGQGSRVVRLHHKLPPLLRAMMEVRWADHMDRCSELESPYARALTKLKQLSNPKTR